jgi:hypothetical protein
MKHVLVRVCVFLLLGAIINIAVAWGCGWRSAPDQLNPIGWSAWVGDRRVLDDFSTVVLRVRGFGMERCRTEPPMNYDASYKFTEFGPAWPWWLAEPPGNGSAKYSTLPAHSYFAQGWPMRALWCELTDFHRYIKGGVFLHREGTFRPIEHVLAFRPIWPGFAINTVFYAAVLWLLFAAPFALRRRRRIKRGLCPQCAYPVGASPVCTECGAAVAGDAPV